MSTRNRIFAGLFLIIALILIVQPASAAIQTYLDPGYNYGMGYMASGGWQSINLDVTSTDDYNILALVYSNVNDFDLYVFDPATGTYITSATAPYSTDNRLTYIWAVSTLKPGKYLVYIHSTSGAGNFAFIHFYNRQPIQRTTGTPDVPVTHVPVTQVPVTQAPVVQTQDPIIGVWRYSDSTGFDDRYRFNADGTYLESFYSTDERETWVFDGTWSAQGGNRYVTHPSSTEPSGKFIFDPTRNAIYWEKYSILLYTPYQGNVATASTTGSTPPTPTPQPAPSGTGSVSITALSLVGEYVTITNSGSSPVNMDGWRLSDSGGKHIFTFRGTTLPAGGSKTITSGSSASGGKWYPAAWSIWNNEGDTASLYDNSYHLVSRLTEP